MINSENKFKVIFLGNSGVGKSSIISRFCNDKFDPSFQSTVGLDFHKKEIPYEKTTLKLLFYDTAGQEKFRSLIPMYVRDANIMVIVYDITNSESFSQLTFWLGMLEDLKREEAILVILGNKSDMDDRRVIQTDYAKEFAKKYNAIFTEVSAKTGANIQDLFLNEIVRKIVNSYKIKENIEVNKSNFSIKDESSFGGSSELETNKQNTIILKDSKDELNKDSKKKKCC